MITIPLTKGQAALLDDCDAHLAALRWSSKPDSRTTYAFRWTQRPDGKRVRLRLHRAVLNAPPGVEVDHINGNGLDCRRSNLRLATASQNKANVALRRDSKSGFKGVSFDARDRKWCARIQVAGRKIGLGRFTDPVSAARAYDAGALRYFGTFARLNFPGPASSADLSPGA